MKLIRCNTCNDVVRLVHIEWRTCDCKESGGQYNEDLLSATVAGNCQVLGLSNLFFDEEFCQMNHDEQVEYRKEIGHHWCEIWRGEVKGDHQIIRIDNPLGPRIDMDVEWIEEGKITRSTITDDREYRLNIPGDTTKRELVLHNAMEPSFIDSDMRDSKKQNDL